MKIEFIALFIVFISILILSMIFIKIVERKIDKHIKLFCKIRDEIIELLEPKL